MTTQDQPEQPAAPSAYDETPYQSHPFPQSQPARLAAMATLFGLTPPDIRGARVLELGCAAGGNLIPMAATWPGSRCLGVDLSARQIEEGQATVHDLGLSNCELRHASITDITPEWGQFDYIVCHGVWSWVPEEVRAHIFQVCRDNLAPDGVAYVSYNVYPGWHMRGAIRDLMRWHTSGFTDPAQKAQQARAVLQFLCDSTPPEGDPYGLMLRNEAQLLARQGDYYLLHDHLEEVNHPVYFHEFIREASANDLDYLCETELRSMLPIGLPPQTVATLSRIAPDIYRMEQYLDFLRNRTFRQTLLVHAGRAVNRNLTPTSLEKLAIASALKPQGQVDPKASGKARFVLPNGVTADTTGPLTKAALLALAEAWPQPVAFPHLLDAARRQVEGDLIQEPDPAGRPAAAQALGTDLLQLYTAGLLEIWPHALPLATGISAQPRAFALARWQAERIPAGSQGTVTNMRHETIGLDALSIRILALLDGQRDRPAILDAMETHLVAGTITLLRDGQPITDPVLYRGSLVTFLDEALHRLASFALIED
ncbi:methyltransferase regulatory domain-containing protein [Acidithiobacillus sp.]|uniref:methyltransferase regulatory domain-containing protein n=1 Tax=Acidithiobacillus sp. TaxID=1872118 RepID=UPI003D073C39